MHHLLGKAVHFVHVESGGERDVAAFLRNEGWNVIVNPTAKTARDFAPGERSAVVRGIRRAFDPATEPRVETVLVDLMLENSRLHLMDEGERKEIVPQAGDHSPSGNGQPARPARQASFGFGWTGRP